MNPYPGLIIHVVANLSTGSRPGREQKCIPAIVTDVDVDRLILTLFAPVGPATDAARRVVIMRGPGAFHALDECSRWWEMIGPEPIGGGFPHG